MTYESTVSVTSEICSDVTYVVRKMSFDRRLEFTRLVRELGARLEFLQAGDGLSDRLEAASVTGSIDRLYLQWGLVSISGLTIDGEPATPAALTADGPEGLCREIIQAIKGECGLSEEERKN